MDITTHMNQDEICELCRKIDMPNEMVIDMLTSSKYFLFNKLKKPFEMLFSTETADDGFAIIKQKLENETKSKEIILMLYLNAALCTYERYKMMGISDEIFYDTMKCFTRFVNEHKKSYDSYNFDRGFWTYRQINQSLYRIGELEFEMYHFPKEELLLDGEVVLRKGDSVLSVHIPSDAKIDHIHCQESYKLAKEFFASFYPDFKYKTFYCESWLMSPNLAKVLPENSKILQFQSDYTVCNKNDDDQGYKLWVYDQRGVEPIDFKEETSLQRNIKKYVLAGGKVGSAAAIIL